MALQAENIKIACFDEPRIRRAVGRMAGDATLGLDRQMLENEWSLLIGMAGVADRIPCRRRPELFADEPSVGVVAIRTVNEPFLHAMMEWHVELRLDLLMAGVAKTWLSLDQEELVHQPLVGRVAA